jgi:hypothetical protein
MSCKFRSWNTVIIFSCFYWYLIIQCSYREWSLRNDELLLLSLFIEAAKGEGAHQHSFLTNYKKGESNTAWISKDDSITPNFALIEEA